MAQTLAHSLPETAAAKGLLARIIGIIFAPRATYPAVAARPRWLGVTAVVLLVMASCAVVFFSTEVGREALLDMQVRFIEGFGRNVPDQAYQALEESLSRPYTPYLAAINQMIFVPVIMLVISGIAIGIFTAALGGDGTFKQVFAVVAHSGVITAAQQLFVYPLDYARGTLSSPASLAVFLPFLDENTFAARLLGAVDLFVIWWIVNLSIGRAVLYKRRTGPIALGVLTTYLILALLYAAARTALSGA